MKHLTDREIVDLIDHALPPDRMAHAASCTDCGARAEAARDMLLRVDEVEIPEPSPLFWDHFSARVREGIANETPSSYSGRALIRTPAIAWALSSALLLAIVIGGVAMKMRSSIAARPAATIATASPQGSATTTGMDDAVESEPIDSDVAWGLVRTVADDLSWDDTVAAGLGAAPGSADRAVGSLTVAERAELMALLEAETKKPGA